MNIATGMTYQAKTPPLQGRAAFLKNANEKLKILKNNLEMLKKGCRFGVEKVLKRFNTDFNNNNTFEHAGVSPVFLRFFDAFSSDSNVLLFINSLEMEKAKEFVIPAVQGIAGDYDHTSNTPLLQEAFLFPYSLPLNS